MLNIIHVKKNVKRGMLLLKELQKNNITNYKIIDAETNSSSFIICCKLSHLNIVKQAKFNGLPFVIIAEDDIEFTCKDSLDEFYKFCFKNQNTDIEVLLGGVYLSSAESKKVFEKIKSDELQTVKCPKSFSGLHLYCVYSNAYDKILESEKEAEMHLDAYLARNLNCHTLYPFVAIQSPGFSDNVSKEVDYNYMFAGLKLYKNQ